MFTVRKLSLYFDRTTQQWIVLDPDGNYWIVSTGDSDRDQPEPFVPSDTTELQPIPGHYKYSLGLRI